MACPVHYDENGNTFFLTASGERFDENGLTAASNVIPLGTRLKVKYDPDNDGQGMVVEVVVNDTGSTWDLDLSKAAFRRLASLDRGKIPVSWRVI